MTTMSSHFDGKIKKLQHLLPTNGIITQQCMDLYGIYRQLSRKYVLSGWLERVGNGAFKRQGNNVSWEAALNAIQKQLKSPVHIGAKSALEIKGGGHYLKLGRYFKMFLFSYTTTCNLPKWFYDQNWKLRFMLIKTNLFPEGFEVGHTKEEMKGFEVVLSSKERAIFELLYLIPKHQTWNEADLIFENLVSLRPKEIQILLEKCSSIKVKRMFLFFAERHNHQWFKKLDLKKIDLGSGDRLIHKKGKLDKKYRITVPKSLLSENNYDKD